MKTIFNDYKQLLMVCMICIAIVSSVLIYSNYSLKRDEDKRKYEQQKLLDEANAKEIEETNKRLDLNACMATANTNRTNLWNANCTNGETNCSLRQTIIDWIDERYNAEVDVCIARYK